MEKKITRPTLVEREKKAAGDALSEDVDDIAHLFEVCNDMGSWLPIPRLREIAERQHVDIGELQEKRQSSYKRDLCELLRKKLDAKKTPFKSIEYTQEQDIQKRKFLPFLLGDENVYGSLLDHEKKFSLPKLSQAEVLKEWHHLFGFPLTWNFPGDTEREALNKVLSFKQSLKPCTDSDPCPYVFDIRDGSVKLEQPEDKKVVEFLPPNIDNMNDFKTLLYTHNASEAKAMRQIFRKSYQNYLDKELGVVKSATCRQIYGATSSFNPRYLAGPIVGFGLEGMLFEVPELKHSSVVKRVLVPKPQLAKTETLIVYLAKKLHGTGVMPEIYGIWVCDHENAFNRFAKSDALYILMEKIIGVSLNRWLKIHASDPNRVQAVSKRLLEKLKLFHLAAVVHGDFHQRNVLVDGKDNPYIIDVGALSFFARDMDDYIRDVESINLDYPEWREYQEKLEKN